MAEEIDIEELKKIVEEGSQKKKKTAKERKKERKKRVETVEDIVEKMKEKYKKEGAYIREEVTTADRIIEKFVTPTVKITGSPEDLAKFEHPLIRAVGKIYVRLKGVFDRIMKGLFKEGIVKKLDWQLYAANIPLSGSQYAAMIAVLSFFGALIGFIAGALFGVKYGITGLLFPLLFALLFFIFVTGIMLAVPSLVASGRARKIDKTLPFALRHLAVEIRSGTGLYQALQAVGRGNYGVLSEEINRTIKEIDEGATTELALANLSARVKSKGLKRAIAQIIRALRLGGNLSDVIMEIAKDISFEQRMKVAEFAEKLNVLGIIFMFVAVVFPVMLSVISSIGYAPTGSKILSAFALPVNLLYITYVILFPGILILLLYFVKSSDPMR